MNESMKLSCEEAKKYNNSFILRTIGFCVIIAVLALISQQSTRQHNETLEAFKNGKEITCSSFGTLKIVSQEKGYHLDTDPNYITNGDNIFFITHCKSREN